MYNPVFGAVYSVCYRERISGGISRMLLPPVVASAAKQSRKRGNLLQPFEKITKASLIENTLKPRGLYSVPVLLFLQISAE